MKLVRKLTVGSDLICTDINSLLCQEERDGEDNNEFIF